MSKILIETYRKFDILFDIYKETFYAVSLELDIETEKKTFTSVKKSIDDFIKENQDFKPFVIEKIGSYYSKRCIKTITGIRKDNIFVAEEGDKKGQLSEYEIKDYVLYNESNDAIWSEMDAMNEQRNILSNKINDMYKSLSGTPLSEIHKKYTI